MGIYATYINDASICLLARFGDITADWEASRAIYLAALHNVTPGHQHVV